MKKGDLSLEFTFLIFLAVIVVMVVVTLIIKFAVSGQGFVCHIVGTCEKAAPPVPDNQVVNMSLQPCDRVKDEIVKHSKICYERWLDLASNDVSICYDIISPGGCPLQMQADVNAALVAENINGTMYADPASTNLVVTFQRKGRLIAII